MDNNNMSYRASLRQDIKRLENKRDTIGLTESEQKDLQDLYKASDTLSDNYERLPYSKDEP